MDTLVTLHCYQNRPYPRPQAACPDCGTAMILCWGSLRKPYWRHAPNAERSCSSNGESLTHKLAKTYLTNYLNEGGIIQSRHICQRTGVKCNTIWSDIVISLQSTGIVKFVEEFPLSYYDTKGDVQYIIYDIAGLNHDDQIVVGIEIRHTHTTNRKPEGRDIIPWLEVSAQEVLEMLDITPQLPMINLTKLNNSSQQYCNDYCRDLIKHYARQLGYISIDYPYPNESFRLVQAALTGKYRCNTERWSSRAEDNSDKRHTSQLWSKFLSMKVCIRCEKHHEDVKYGRPYCMVCYKKTNNEDADEYPIQYITPQEKSALRSRFAWLNNVPGNWRVRSPCSFCKEIEICRRHRRDSSYIWWFGDKKRCCTYCLAKIDSTNNINTNIDATSSTSSA